MGRKKNPNSEGRGFKLSSIEAKNEFAQWCIDHEREMGRTGSRILRWFVRADDLVQAVVLDGVIPRLRNAHADALVQLAEEVRTNTVKHGEVIQKLEGETPPEGSTKKASRTLRKTEE